MPEGQRDYELRLSQISFSSQCVELCELWPGKVYHHCLSVFNILTLHNVIDEEEKCSILH